MVHVRGLWLNSVCLSVVSYLVINNLRYQIYIYTTVQIVWLHMSLAWFAIYQFGKMRIIIYWYIWSHLKFQQEIQNVHIHAMYVLFIWKPGNNMIKVISRWHICFIGFGDSTGFPSEDGCVADSYFLYKWVRKRSAQVPVIIWGHSLGTG